MKEFEINEFIKLRLKIGKTSIYIKKQLFRQHKFLQMIFPTMKEILKSFS
jgi:hypothetical protein